MLILLHPTYTLKVEIKDALQQGSLQSGVGIGVGPGAIGVIGTGFVSPSAHKWFNPGAGKIGCDEVLALVRDALLKAGVPATVTFEKFEHS